MTLFDERERAFENLFAHEEGGRCRALARRNQLFAAGRLNNLGCVAQSATPMFAPSLMAQFDPSRRRPWSTGFAGISRPVMTQCRMSAFAVRWCGRQQRLSDRCGLKLVLQHPD